MTDPKTRALSLVGELESDTEDVCAMGFPDATRSKFAALRLAITQIPTTSWQPMETAPKEDPVRLLVENTSQQPSPRFVIDAEMHGSDDDEWHWFDIAEGEPLEAHLRPLAWRPADSTELPEDWGAE